nr:uncharacterized protein LOC109149905 [Ipomoea batatas]
MICHREELNDYCRRPELKRDLVTGKFPKACYTLDKPARETLCEWARNLKFPYGYASNMSRCVDMKKLKLFAMKSHDCHVFMQRLITIAFRELLPLNVWKVLTELSLFFKNLTSTTIRVEEMMKLENDIPLILCQLERYYVNGFKFHTIGYGGAKETMNSGVCIKGINYSVDESDYFGRLVEVVQVEYLGLPIKRTVLFKCDWFDPTSVGMKVHSKYKLVEVNHKRRFNRYEPFVLAMQAAQSPGSIGSPADLPISSPSNSNAPPTSSSFVGSSTGCDLTIIHVENVRLIPSHTCSSSMTKIFMKMIHPNGYAWKNVPNEYKDLYFEEFKKFYKWDESIEAQVRKVFLAQAGLRYADMLSKFKNKRISTRRLDCVAEETWAIWEAYWDRPDVKAKSEQQRKNRMSEVEGPGTGCSKHTGGSRSAIEHYHKLRDELQKEPNLFECFEQMHKKKDGMFVDERSKRIAEEIQAHHDAARKKLKGQLSHQI